MLKRFPRNPHWRYSGVFVDEARNEKDHFDVCPVLLQVIILQRMLVSEESSLVVPSAMLRTGPQVREKPSSKKSGKMAGKCHSLLAPSWEE
jgi:hypothetical protein